MFHCFCPNISTFKDFHCTGHGITKLPPTSTGVVRVTPKYFKDTLETLTICIHHVAIGNMCYRT